MVYLKLTLGMLFKFNVSAYILFSPLGKHYVETAVVLRISNTQVV